MDDLLQFLSSSEAIIVYIVAAISCCLCFIIYLVERNNVKLRQKHNTKELNKLVSKVKEEAHIVDQPMYDVPVMEPIEIVDESTLSDMLQETQVMRPVSEVKVVEPVPEKSISSIELEDVDILEEAKQNEELQYTSIEPDMETAQLELKKLTEELEKQEEIKDEEIDQSIMNYERQQEDTAIISLDELLQKGKDMYAANEKTQYMDDGSEPISIKELENQYGREATPYLEPFMIEKVVPEEEVLEEIQEEKKELIQPEVSYQTSTFKSSPIISPIYGIEKQSDENRDLELENTADYTKLDAEIKKTNEFLMTLKDLQQKID